MTVTYIIIGISVVLSYLSFQNPLLFHQLKHWPYAEMKQNEYYRLLTSGFIHGSWLHLFINMFVLFQFGGILEMRFTKLFGPYLGMVNYSMLYIATLVLADVPTLFKHKNNPGYAAVGASGAVSGIIFTYILFDPWTLLYLYAIIPIPGIIAGVLYLVYSSWASKNSRDNIDHDAHFFGAIIGISIAILMHPPSLWRFLENLSNIPYF